MDATYVSDVVEATDDEVFASLASFYATMATLDYAASAGAIFADVADVDSHRFEWFALTVWGRLVTWRDSKSFSKSRSVRLLPSFENMSDMTADFRRPLHRFPVAPPCIRALAPPLGLALPPQLVVKYFAAAAERWTQDADDEGRALAQEAARRYGVAAWFESAFSVLIGVEAEIQGNARVTVLTSGTIDAVSDGLGRAILNEYSGAEWEHRGSELIARLRLARTVISSAYRERPPLSPVPLLFVKMATIRGLETRN